MRQRPNPSSSTWLRFGTRSVIAALGTCAVALALVWQHVQPANGIRALGLDPESYPGAAVLVDGVGAPDARMRPTVFEARTELPTPTRDGCITGWDDRDVVTCTYGDPDASRTIAVVGSSHAEHWMSAMEVLAEQYQFRVIVYLKMGCPLTASPVFGAASPYCDEWSRDVIARLGQDRPDWVFTTATRPRAGSTGDETPREYVDVWTTLQDGAQHTRGSRHTVASTAWRPLQRHRLSRGRRQRRILWHASSGAFDPINPAVAAASELPNVYVLDLTDAVCGPTMCRAVEGNVLVYSDEHHLTVSYMRTLTSELGRQIGAIVGWW